MNDPTLTYVGAVKDSAIRIPKRFKQEVCGLFEGKEIEVTVRRKRKRRSLPQNAYYWAVCVPAIRDAFREWDMETGWTAEMVHEVLKDRFLPMVREWGRVVIPATGEVIDEVPTTRKLTTTQFSEYVERIQHWAAEMGIVIPDPLEQAEMNFHF